MDIRFAEIPIFVLVFVYNYVDVCFDVCVCASVCVSVVEIYYLLGTALIMCQLFSSRT